MKKLLKLLWNQVKSELRESLENLIVRILLMFIARIQQKVRDSVVYLPTGRIDIINSPIQEHEFTSQIRMLQGLTNPESLKVFVKDVLKDDDLNLLIK